MEINKEYVYINKNNIPQTSPDRPRGHSLAEKTLSKMIAIINNQQSNISELDDDVDLEDFGNKAQIIKDNFDAKVKNMSKITKFFFGGRIAAKQQAVTDKFDQVMKLVKGKGESKNLVGTASEFGETATKFNETAKKKSWLNRSSKSKVEEEGGMLIKKTEKLVKGSSALAANAKNLNKKVQEENKGGFFSRIFGGKKEKPAVLDLDEDFSEPVAKGSRMEKNHEMIKNASKDPSVFVDTLTNALRNDAKNKSDSLFINNFITDFLKPLFEDSWVAGHVQETASQADNWGPKYDAFEKSIIPAFKERKKDVENIIGNIQEFVKQNITPNRKQIVEAMDGKEVKLGGLQTFGLQFLSKENKKSAEDLIKLLNFMSENLGMFKDVRGRLKEGSKTNQIFDKLLNMGEILKDDKKFAKGNIAKTEEELVQAFVDIVVLSLEAINDYNGKK